jgi:hypothetical protein
MIGLTINFLIVIIKCNLLQALVALNNHTKFELQMTILTPSCNGSCIIYIYLNIYYLDSWAQKTNQIDPEDIKNLFFIILVYLYYY